MRKRLLGITVFVLVLLTIAMPIICYCIVASKSSDRIYDKVDSIPYNEVGMVLGTGPTTITGKTNSYFLFRIDAVEELYKAGKIKYILISGDNSRKDYSEPDVMKDSLVARGIPAEVIYLDYAGFRTLDSVVRSKKVFGQNKMTVISQRFHNERSIILGDWQEMELIGYNAKETISHFHRIRAHIREGFARIKLFLDILTNKQPKFLGDPIHIGKNTPQVEVNDNLSASKVIPEDKIVIKKDNNLVFYYPQYNYIDFVCGTMPEASDNSVLFCCEAAFTGELLNEFKHSNIAGNHVSLGRFYKGYKCGANSGYFEWDKANDKWKFATGRYIQVSNNNINTAFEQVLIIHNGVKAKKQAQKQTSKNEYRVLAEHNGKLCIIDSNGITAYPDFVANLLKSGVKHALYLDMGAGWNYSYYRDNNGKVTYIHTQRIKNTTNWIVFRK